MLRPLISLFAGLLALSAFASPALAQTAYPAMAEVSAARAARGLPPFIENQALTRAAQGAAQYRAARLISGHTANNFAFLPRGAQATAAGCAAWEPRMGWGSCFTYEGHRYGGAAW